MTKRQKPAFPAASASFSICSNMCGSWDKNDFIASSNCAANSVENSSANSADVGSWEETCRTHTKIP